MKKITTLDIERMFYSYNIKMGSKDLDLLLEELDVYFMPIQNRLNIELTGNEFYAKELITIKGKTINFGNCIISEANELLDCVPWKHWKDVDKEIDYKNMELEIADLFHFIPSVLLCLWDIYPDGQKKTKPFSYFVLNICDRFIDREISKFIEQNDGLNRQVIESISAWTSLYGSMVSQLFRLKINGKENNNTFYDCTSLESMAKEAVVTGIAVLHMLINLHSLLFQISYSDSLNRIKQIYTVKNCLNAFRAENGYKEGTYVKIWNGKEDNEVALEIAAEIGELSIDKLKLALEMEYQKVLKNNTLM